MNCRILACSLVAAGAALAALDTHAAPVQWSENGHYYEFISGAYTWEGAVADAASRTYLGLTGYLATATSAGENDFIAGNTVSNGALAWLGGSDAGAAVDDWTWRTGPEAGQAFVFTNWSAGEPNNCCGGEDHLQTNWWWPGAWNDNGGPGNIATVNGYVVEFGTAVPEPESVAMMLAGLGLVGAMIRRRKT